MLLVTEYMCLTVSSPEHFHICEPADPAASVTSRTTLLMTSLSQADCTVFLSHTPTCQRARCSPPARHKGWARHSVQLSCHRHKIEALAFSVCASVSSGFLSFTDVTQPWAHQSLSHNHFTTTTHSLWGQILYTDDWFTAGKWDRPHFKCR